MQTEPTDPFDIELAGEWMGCAPASERLFFADMPVAQVVAYEEHRREARCARVFAGAQRLGHAALSPGPSLEIWPA